MSNIGEFWKLEYDWTSELGAELGSIKCKRLSAVVAAKYVRNVGLDGKVKLSWVMLRRLLGGAGPNTIGTDGATSLAHVRIDI